MKKKIAFFLPPALAAVLSTLKLAGILPLGWLWALSPLWIPFAAFIAAAFAVFLWIWQDMLRHPDAYKDIDKPRQ